MTGPLHQFLIEKAPFCLPLIPLIRLPLRLLKWYPFTPAIENLESLVTAVNVLFLKYQLATTAFSRSLYNRHFIAKRGRKRNSSFEPRGATRGEEKKKQLFCFFSSARSSSEIENQGGLPWTVRRAMSWRSCEKIEDWEQSSSDPGLLLLSISGSLKRCQLTFETVKPMTTKPSEFS